MNQLVITYSKTQNVNYAEKDNTMLFNYDSENSNSVRYGKFYWGVILSDGRYLSFNADSVNVIDGSLVAQREIVASNETDGLPQNMLIIASGQWASCFAANVLTGDPVCIDRTEGSKDKVKKTT